MRINPINNTALLPQFSIKKGSNKYLNQRTEPVSEPVVNNVNFNGLFSKKIKAPSHEVKYAITSLLTSNSDQKAKYLGKKGSKDLTKLISLGVAGYAIDRAAENNSEPKVLLGGDTDFFRTGFLDTIINTIRKQGVNVIEIKQSVPTPIFMNAAKYAGIDVGIMIKPDYSYEDGGYNIVTPDGVIAPKDIKNDIAANIENIAEKGKYKQKLFKRGFVGELNPLQSYRYDLMNSYIDWNEIKNSGLKIYYDGMGGHGNDMVVKLFNSFGIEPEVIKLHVNNTPDLQSNLNILKDTVVNSKENFKVGFANDVNGENFGVLDEKGNYIDYNDVLLLIGYHLAENRGQKGTIVKPQATSMQIDKLAEKYGLSKIDIPTGFKYIPETILKLRDENKDILVAGDGKSALTIKDHIPEKDGIIAISLIMDLMAEEQKPLSQILKEVKQNLGKQYVSNNFSIDLKGIQYPASYKSHIISKLDRLYDDAVNKCEDDLGDELHTIDSERTENIRKSIKKYDKNENGIKLVLTDGSAILISPNETESTIKCYIDAAGKTIAEAKENYENLKIFVDEFLSE